MQGRAGVEGALGAYDGAEEGDRSREGLWDRARREGRRRRVHASRPEREIEVCGLRGGVDGGGAMSMHRGRGREIGGQDGDGVARDLVVVAGSHGVEDGSGMTESGDAEEPETVRGQSRCLNTIRFGPNCRACFKLGSGQTKPGQRGA